MGAETASRLSFVYSWAFSSQKGEEEGGRKRRNACFLLPITMQAERDKMKTMTTVKFGVWIYGVTMYNIWVDLTWDCYKI